ncbi:MAG: AbrB/MazE/SpoVT family DNA-binding domain-containing protein [Thermoprotei archaeon]|nr:AbrB/MazE/SpoVT family DNA-binding domain-containing protein [Thermoprotei archaeon]
MSIEGRVGSKGELFPPKSIRRKLGLKPHMKVIYRVENGRLIVEPIPTLEDILEKPPEIEISLEDFHKFRKELSKEAET